MGEYVRFSHKRLLVGFRRCDWARVWYEPCTAEGVEPNEDGDVPIGLYQVARGGPKPREPLDAEVAWMPLYHFDNFPADGPGKTKTKKAMQQRFLWDCWRYMNEKDPDEIAKLEEELHKPNHRQWQAWFNVAKKEKKKQQSARTARRVARASTAAAAGHDVAEIEINSDSSDDSGFESDEESRVMSRKTEMAPPRRQPASRGTKRSGPGGGANGSKGGAKKKKGPQGRGGGNGSPLLPLPGGSRPRPGGGSGSAAIPIDDDDDDTSAVGWDGRTPERFSPSSTGTGLFVSRSGPVNELDGRAYLMGETDTPLGSRRENSVFGDASMINGGLNEAEAIRQAIEQSVEPDGNALHNGGLDDEEATRRAIEQSVEPGANAPNNGGLGEEERIRQSIEGSVEPDASANT